MSGPRNGIIPQTGACGELRTVRAGQEPRLGTSPRTGTDELRPAPQSRTTPDPCRRKNARGRTFAAAPPGGRTCRRPCRPPHGQDRIVGIAGPCRSESRSDRQGHRTGICLGRAQPSSGSDRRKSADRRGAGSDAKDKKRSPAATRSRVGGATPNRPIHGTEKMRGRSMPSSLLARFLPKQCNPQPYDARLSPQLLRGESRRKFSGENSGENERDLFVRRTPGRTQHGHITERERTKAGDSGTAAGQRQDNSGKTAERRQRDDRTAAEKQRNGGRETTGRRRRNSRDTTGQRQDSSRETAERRQRNDRTAAQKQQGHGGETTGQQRRNSGTAAGKRQDAGGKTAGTRRGNDRTPAEKQQGHGGETTGQRRKNSRDTAGKRQDAGGETAGTRQGNDKTTAEKQRNGGRETTGQQRKNSGAAAERRPHSPTKKGGDRSIPVPSPVAARRRAIARIPALGVPPAVNSRRSAPPCPCRCGSAFRGSRLPRGSASKGR